jgi:hypothetical protein
MMAFKVKTKPVATVTKLGYFDPDQPDEAIEVEFRQASSGDDLRVASLFSKQRQIFNDEQLGETIIEREWNWREVERFRVYLTLCGCNLIDENEDPVFRFKTTRDGDRLDMNHTEFNAAYDALPSEITKEMYMACLAVNPQWDVSKQGE